MDGWNQVRKVKVLLQPCHVVGLYILLTVFCCYLTSTSFDNSYFRSVHWTVFSWQQLFRSVDVVKSGDLLAKRNRHLQVHSADKSVRRRKRSAVVPAPGYGQPLDRQWRPDTLPRFCREWQIQIFQRFLNVHHSRILPDNFKWASKALGLPFDSQ